TFYAASCHDCGLWFQNPRPVESDIPLLYPNTYLPHAEASPRIVPPPRPSNVLRNVWRGWHRGFLEKNLGYKQELTSGRAARFGAAMGANFSLAARWRAGCDLIPRFVPGGRLLEIGCGNGGTLKRFRDLGWQDLHGIELSDAAARIARRAGFPVTTTSIESALETYPDNSFDVIVAEMVLEHLLNSFKVVQQIARKLKPGGEFLFSTVVRDSLDGRIFGPYGVCYDFPRHMVFFRKRDLDDMLQPDFDQIHSWHQSTPIDFQRPAHLRAARFDPHLRTFFKSRAGARVVQTLARLKLMGRVSYRCRRKL
ncbi:MAG TPA: class I SAM-dependent methyltransferase, partial [Pyrinomonadaceae bacterium]|nr:class I SAM-dependent methyltransferase [Pyrinomonadaceae bacterium]